MYRDVHTRAAKVYRHRTPESGAAKVPVPAATPPQHRSLRHQRADLVETCRLESNAAAAVADMADRGELTQTLSYGITWLVQLFFRLHHVTILSFCLAVCSYPAINYCTL